MIQKDKRAKGQYYTTSSNPFNSNVFRRWADQAGLSRKKILEPFAGANHIIKSLRFFELCNDFISYDISPAHHDVMKRDTIKSFPKGFSVCVTNPPWLAKNSATRRGLPFPTTKYDDMYKFCLELCLINCEYVAALVPASYLQNELFRDRLQTYILLHGHIFNETENPVCLALFSKEKSKSIDIFYDDKFIGKLDELKKSIPNEKTNRDVKFNDPNGILGFISFDNTYEPSIRFCNIEEILSYEIKVSSRFITRISGDFDNIENMISRMNKKIKNFRDKTHDIFLTPFKGMRDDGYYRRRMFYSLARRFINGV